MKTISLLSVFILLFSWNLTGQSSGSSEKVKIITGFGEIYLKLDLKHAPVTTLNFLRYVDANMFEDACFYRVVRNDNQPNNPVKIQVIQGGRYKNEDSGFPPIIHETTNITGILHKNGTISMARSEPGTATSEFFICVGDQPELDFGGKRNPDGQGFAAFGKVVKGMRVVRKIHSIHAPEQYLNDPVPIKDIYRVGE